MGRTISVTVINGIHYDQDGNKLTSRSRPDLLAKMTEEEKHQIALSDPDGQPSTDFELSTGMKMAEVPGNTLEEKCRYLKARALRLKKEQKEKDSGENHSQDT